MRPRTDSQNEAFSSKFYGIMITKSISYKTSMFTIQNVERPSSQAQGTPLQNCIEALAQGRGHRGLLQEVPSEVSVLWIMPVQFKHSFMVVSSWQMSYLNQAGQAVNTNVLRYNSFVQLVPRVFLLVILWINAKDPLSLKLECRKLQGLHGFTTWYIS